MKHTSDQVQSIVEDLAMEMTSLKISKVRCPKSMKRPFKDLRDQLKESESQKFQLEILQTKYERVVEENKLMQETINFLVSQNEENKKASDEHMRILNERIDSILSKKPLETRNLSFYFKNLGLPENDPIANEVIFQKLQDKIKDLEFELENSK